MTVRLCGPEVIVPVWGSNTSGCVWWWTSRMWQQPHCTWLSCKHLSTIVCSLVIIILINTFSGTWCLFHSHICSVATVLEFYFRFWPSDHHWYVILRHCAKFFRNHSLVEFYQKCDCGPQWPCMAISTYIPNLWCKYHHWSSTCTRKSKIQDGGCRHFEFIKLVFCIHSDPCIANVYL